jgi:hypothetical protein
MNKNKKNVASLCHCLPGLPGADVAQTGEK